MSTYSSTGNPKLDHLIAKYLESEQAGIPPDRHAMLQLHSNLADDLRSFFANHDQMQALANRAGEPIKHEPADPTSTYAMEDDATADSPVAAQETTQGISQTFPDTAPIGDQLRDFGDYQILSEIARGGMGVVYKARQTKLKRTVALKMIRSAHLAGEDDVQRFYTEAEAAATLDHPGIVPVYEVGERDGQHFFSMGYVDGSTLAEKITDGPLPSKVAAEYLLKITEAVAYAHERGVIHRDLKPRNVLLSESDEPRVTDFGLAKLTHSNDELTATGQIMGTPSYMPPEQAGGKVREVTETADVYSLGAILFTLLTARPPFQGESHLETLRQVTEQDPVAPRVLNPLVPVDLETICIKCLEKDRGKRYASAQELAGELSRFLGGEPIHARPISAVARAWRWCERKPVAAAALGLLVVLGIGGPWMAIRQQILMNETALARARSLRNAAPQSIQLILDDIEANNRVVLPELRRILTEKDLTDSERLRVSLALLPHDTEQLNYLRGRIADCEYEEFLVLVERLTTHSKAIVTELWERLHGPDSTPEDRFRAGMALATLEPNSDQWTDDDYVTLANSLVTANPIHQIALRENLAPIKNELLPGLVAAFRTHGNDSVQLAAANVVADYYEASTPTLLAPLLSEANAAQYEILYEEVAKQRDAVRAPLISVTREQPEPDMSEPDRLWLGRRRAGAAISLLRLGEYESFFDVFLVKEDPESLTQFVHRAKGRHVRPDELLECLDKANTPLARYAIMLTLGEFPFTEVPEGKRDAVRDQLLSWFGKDPSSAVHGASGWLLRHWGFTEQANLVEHRIVPYDPSREWYTVEVRAQGSGLFGVLGKKSTFYLTFVVFPAGDYEIGSLKSEVGRLSDELRHSVRLTRPFAILDREVTYADFSAVTGFTGYYNTSDWMKQADSPMVAPSWYMSVYFCRQLGELLGVTEEEQPYAEPKGVTASGIAEDPSEAAVRGAPENWPVRLDRAGFRLPTEAEWEIACRGGTVSRYSFGTDQALIHRYGRFEINSDTRAHAVRSSRPNLRGVYDMHGNMFEWCHDWDGAFGQESVDPTGAPQTRDRVYRGGSYKSTTSRSATRYRADASERSMLLGFRPVVVPSTKPSNDASGAESESRQSP